MGGSISVTIREPDGTEHRMCRWTNVLPWFITNLKLVQDDIEHVRAYLKQWVDMRVDWLENGKGWDLQDYAVRKEPFHHHMTPCYAPYPFLAPQGYGLVVVDMVNKVVLTSQGYTTPGMIYRVSMAGENPQDEESTYGRLKALFDAGRIKEMDVWRRGQKGHTVVPVLWTDARDLQLPSPSRRKDGDIDMCFRVDMRPYVVEVFDECNRASQRALRERVLSLGFVLTDEEERMWAEHDADLAEREVQVPVSAA